MVVGADRDGEGGISRTGDGGVGVRLQKDRVIGGKSMDGQPDVVDAIQENGVVDPDAPDAGSRRLKAHEDQLVAGYSHLGPVVDGDDGLLQAEGDQGLIAKNLGNPLDDLSCGGDEAHGIELRGGSPEFQGEAGFPGGHPKLHLLVFHGWIEMSHKMISVPHLIAGGADGRHAQVPAQIGQAQ